MGVNRLSDYYSRHHSSCYYWRLAWGFKFYSRKYAKHAAFATHSWLKMLWESLSLFGFKEEMNDMAGALPRRNDKSF